MTLEHDSETLSRRAFLRALAAGTAGLALLPQREARAHKEGKSPYAPFKMGIQSYSLRAFKTEDALAKTKALGLTWWEAYPEHFPLTDDPKKISDYKEMLKSYGIRMATYGVVDFQNDEKDARAKLAFAKAMGLETLSAYPSLDSFPLLDGLVDEYKINLAIHNHGPGDNLYDKFKKGLAAINGHNVRIGSCNDTGHYLRSDEDPVEAARRFGKRTYGVHLKDVKGGPGEEKQFTEIGKGRLDTLALLKALKENKYRGVLSLEYEEHEQDPIPYIEECLTATREAIAKLNAAQKSA